MFFLSHLRLAEARHMLYFSGVGGINYCQVLRLNLFCDKALTGETPHSAEFLYDCQVYFVDFTLF